MSDFRAETPGAVFGLLLVGSNVVPAFSDSFVALF